MTGFAETTPEHLPTHPFDQWHAWRGPHPKIPQTELLVEIASWKGQITRATVSIHRPKTGTASEPATLGGLRSAIEWTMEGVGAFFVVLLARRNWKLQRTDIQGAWRVAVARFVLAGIAWAGIVHPLTRATFVGNAVAAAGDWLLSAAILFLVYLALEPAVRARWPHSIVTWNRVLAGRWRDPQVASDILIGAAVGTGMFTFFKLIFALMPKSEPVNFDINLHFAMGVRQWLGGHANDLGGALRLGLLIFLTIFGLRRLLRNDVLAALVAAILFTLMQGDVTYAQDRVVMIGLYIVVYGALAFVLLRSGLVATISALFFAESGNSVMLGVDWNTWYAPAGLASLLLLVGIAVFAFRRSLGTRDLLDGEDSGI
jgi:serine/threonine-protein kinase